jgi:hypothetical protein
VLGRSQSAHRDGFPLQVGDRADPLRPDQLEAADVQSHERDDRVPCLQRQEKRPAEIRGEVDLARGDGRLLPDALFLDPLYVGEPLALE